QRGGGQQTDLVSIAKHQCEVEVATDLLACCQGSVGFAVSGSVYHQCVTVQPNPLTHRNSDTPRGACRRWNAERMCRCKLSQCVVDHQWLRQLRGSNTALLTRKKGRRFHASLDAAAFSAAAAFQPDTPSKSWLECCG